MGHETPRDELLLGILVALAANATGAYGPIVVAAGAFVGVSGYVVGLVSEPDS